ncbi:MAG: alpha amylase C-terminal domain-containing protein, partial [Propionicimonas sp.]|nr:alpha amylase C-terminal domain-containing protein [Propionicimonas sp.]
YRDLIRLRRNTAGRTAGLTGSGLTIFHNNDDANVLAFQRWRDHGPGDDVVVVANLSREPWSGYRIGLPAAGTWRLLFNSDAAVYSDSFGDHPSGDLLAEGEKYDGLDASAELTIAGYSLLIYGWSG